MTEKLLQWLCEVLQGLIEVAIKKNKINMFDRTTHTGHRIEKIVINIDKLIIAEQEIAKNITESLCDKNSVAEVEHKSEEN